MNFRILFIASFVIFSLTAEGQSKWSLAKCIQYAQQNNLSVMQSQLTVQDANLANQAARQARLPNLNATIGGGVQFGLRIDPVTNIPRSESLGYNSLSLNSGITIYNGNKIKNSIKQSKINVKAAEADLKQSTQNIALNVAVAYLNILQAEDQLENTNNRLQLSLSQLDQTDKLIRAGSRPAADLQDIEAQVAQDEQVLVARQNDVDFAYLNLKQLLELDTQKPFTIERPDIEIPEEEDPVNFVLNTIYNKALSTQAGVKASEMRVESAKLDIEMAEADKLPRLTAFGDVGTNYSSRAQDIDLSQIELVLQDPELVEIDNTPAQLAVYSLEGEKFVNKTYFQQLSDNFGQSVGLNLSIPIYNRGITNTNIQRSELALKTNEIQEKQIKQQLKQDIQLAIADAKASHKNYLSAQKTEAAFATAYGNTEKKFKLGASNTLEFTTAKNQWDQAKVESIIAKYDYIFKLKVVDFYQGKKLEL